jgi:dynein heavy chain
MLDLIKPKLVYLDLPLFMALLSDLFPGVELPAAEGGALRRAIEAELRESNLQVGASREVFLRMPLLCIRLLG